MVLGVMHKGGRQVSPLPYRVFLQTEACKPSTFNLQKRLPCLPALPVPMQIPQPVRLGLVEQDVRSETLTETPAQHDSINMMCSHPLGRKLPTNRIPRRAAELPARKGNLEKERRKGKASLQALRDAKIFPCTAT